MKTEALKQALDQYGFDAAFGGARRDEEKSPRQGTHLFVPHRRSIAGTRRTSGRNCGSIYNTRKRKGESIRVFPLSNWTELDIWQYIHLRRHPDRAAVFRHEAPGGGARRHADHGRRRPHAAAAGRDAEMRMVRFRTLGCYPLTGAIESEATTLPEIIQEMLLHDLGAPGPRRSITTQSASMEKKKREGYF